MILDRASAAIPPGAHVGLIGRNGAGKSTLMKAVIGLIDPDEGSIEMPRRTKLGYIAQEAPTGTATPFETVLAADAERAALMEEADTCLDPHRLGDIHDRLLAIDAYTAPARAARVLQGLGFDEAMQARPLDSYSGGWKMRVALAALLFSEPDLLLLDEPSNHLDLEAALWLENFLGSYAGTLIVISHERDLLNNVVDTILQSRTARSRCTAAAMTASNASVPSGPPRSQPRRRPRTPSVPACRTTSLATVRVLPLPSRRSRAPRCSPRCSRLRPWLKIPVSVSISLARPNSSLR
jgi:ATPase subunit of ABC transporter with duplicated ATPase domains